MDPKGRREYAYRQSWWVIVLGGLFFGGGSVFMALMAAGNTRGLVIDYVIELSPRSASWFYGIVAGVSGLFVVAVILQMFNRLARPQSVILESDALIVPKSSLSSTVVRIPYAEIESVDVLEVAGESFMKIKVRNGSKRDIMQSLLPDKKAFSEILEALRERAALVPPS